MNILVPINNTEHIIDYVKNGATEFYIGFYDKGWNNKFGEYSDINRLSGYKENANPFTLEDIVIVIDKVHALRAKLYVTFNSSIYSADEVNFIKTYLKILREAGIDGVIVSTPDLIKAAKEEGLARVKFL